MTSSARRDPVRELALLVRAPEPGTTNLAEFVSCRVRELAQVIGASPCELEAMRVFDDEDLAPRLRLLLGRLHDQQVRRDLERRRDRSLAAAEQLGAKVRWTDVGGELDVDVLLGELLADRTKKWVAFCEPAGFNVIIPRHLIAATAPLRRVHIDLAAFVDATGLHFRWRGGRGGYKWFSGEVHPSFAARVLTVRLASKVDPVCAPPRRRGGAWVVHILRELGYVI